MLSRGILPYGGQNWFDLRFSRQFFELRTSFCTNLFLPSAVYANKIIIASLHSLYWAKKRNGRRTLIRTSGDSTPNTGRLLRHNPQGSEALSLSAATVIYWERKTTLGEEHRGTLKGIMSIAPGQFWKENIDFVFLRNAQQTYNLVQLGVRQDSLTRCDVEETYK